MAILRLSTSGLFVFERLSLETINAAKVDHEGMLGAIALDSQICWNRFISVRNLHPFERRDKVAAGFFIKLKAFAQTCHLSRTVRHGVASGGVVSVGLNVGV